jgi:hypothetical protein
MKKIVYCEGVMESWLTSSDSDEYADEKTPYFESGPYYLASDVDARIAELEKALRFCVENGVILTHGGKLVADTGDLYPPAGVFQTITSLMVTGS